MDGGIADSVPFRRAIDVGCDKLVVILSRERSYIKEKGKGETVSARIFGKYPEFSKALKNRSIIYNSQRKELFSLENEGKAFVIAPKDTRGWRRTENNPQKIKEIYDEGYKIGKEMIPSLKEYLGIKV